MEISLSSVIITDFRSSIVFSIRSPTLLFKYSFFDTPDTAMIESRSHTSTLCPKLSYKASAYSFAKSPSSLIGEYFFKITSPSRSTNISSGSPSRIRKVLRISFGITTLPKSSIRRTIPVAFILMLPHFLLMIKVVNLPVHVKITNC
ncbi:Uncharacterised protein [Streptococcus pneumoniae]|nr:Uncharacterised protein [Streptococcus pneumoniae]